MKKKIIVVYRLTLLWLPFLWLLHIMRSYEVYFLVVSNFYRNIGRINNLEKRGIRWVKKNYTNFSDYARADFLAAEFADKIHKKVKLSHIYIKINELIKVKNEIDEKKIGVVWKHYVYRVIKPFAEQVAASEFIKRNESESRVTIITLNSFAYFLKRDIDKRTILHILPGLFFYQGVTNILKIFRNAIKFKLFGRSKNTQLAVPIDKESFVSKEINYDEMEVAYFPHQGIFYGEIFTKDHYYSNDKNSPLHKSKILHISLGEKYAGYMISNYKYYVANGIPFIDIHDIGYRIKDLFKGIFELIKDMNFRIVSDLYQYGFWHMVYAFFLFSKIKVYLLILSKFKKLKLALVGYDYLFPRDLAMALTLQGVKICANEERLIIAFFPDNYLILDYYFVASDIVKKPCLKTSQIDHFMPIGLVRVDDIFRYDKLQIYDEKYDTIKKTKKLIIALDFYLPANDIDDTTRLAAKAWETIQFYKDLLKLANEFPSLHIVIKGKEADSYKSHYITDLVEVINRTENMEIELDYTRYNPYFIGEKADLTIACHTSLCDELLAAGRKVIIYEITDRLDTLFNYNKLPIIADSYESLKYHVQNFINGIYLYKDTIEKIKKEFYSDCYHGNVAKNIRSELEKIIAG